MILQNEGVDKMKKTLIGLFLLTAIFLSACSSTNQSSKPSVECSYDYDCGSGLECVNNHCVRAETRESEGVRVVECNAMKSCGAGYTCSSGRCIII